MALVLDDRVQENTSTTGTGTWTLAGALSGYQTFSAGVGNGNTTYYSASDGLGNWETGTGTYTSSGNTLSRTTVYESSNGGALVSFPANPVVWVAIPALKSLKLDAAGKLLLPNYSQLRTDISSSGSPQSIDLSTSAVQNLTANGNLTLTFDNCPSDSGYLYSFTLFVRQPAVGGKLITWPASVKWPNAIAPTLTTTNNSVDIFSFMTTNAGTSWAGGLAIGNVLI